MPSVETVPVTAGAAPSACRASPHDALDEHSAAATSTAAEPPRARRRREVGDRP